jgi:pantoate--beta-alanine ligase
MKLVHSRAEFESLRRELTGPVGFVATMGALHAGHVALMGMARDAMTTVVATIFVNPLQFSAGEDLSRYPRTLDADLAACEVAGVDVVWVPAAEDIYPRGPARVRIDPGPLGAELEGASRPGHFAGVLTVVAKFFQLVRPDLAFFGQKDYQQFCLIERMVEDLDFPVALVAVPTVRDADGVALSSRNRYLTGVERAAARVLPKALFAGRDAVQLMGRAGVVPTAGAVLKEERSVHVDYLELRGDDLGPAPDHGAARLLVAARVGTTRLIDNVEVLVP